MKIVAKRNVITQNEITKLTVSSSIAGACRSCAKYVPSAASQALTASETSSRKPMPTTSVNDQNRSRRITRNPGRAWPSRPRLC